MFGVSGLRVQMLTRAAPGAAPRARVALRYAVWTLCWVCGHVAGGALLGAGLGWLGGALPPPPAGVRLPLGGPLGGGGASPQFGRAGLPLPHCPRQVPRVWMLRLPWDLVALGYGAQLGFGLATRVKTATFYAVLGCALLAG